MSGADPGSGRRYAKPVVVPDRLDLLCGSTVGIVRLPRHLDWSPNSEYDLDSPGRIVDLYRTVISEATDPADLHAYLDEGTLLRLWSYIWLAPPVRAAWEQKFPELAYLSRAAKVA
jgi:hypothetical protein